MRLHYVFFLLAVAAGLSLTRAQEPTVPGVMVAEHEELGSYLTDTEGNSLYLFLNDQQGGPSNCYERCAQNWPPLLVEGEADPGDGADELLIGTIDRGDGTVQVTYNGWPLYYFIRDQEPGAAVGQGVGKIWYLVSPEGEAVGAPQNTVQEEAGQDEGQGAAAAGASTEVLGHGAEVYQRVCTGCHGQDGGGAEAPRLANNSALRNLDLVLRQIMRGGEYMPAFGNLLSDAEIAAVATYVRNSWGNDFGQVTGEQVAEER